MEISAIVKNAGSEHLVAVRTGNDERPLSIPAKHAGQGSGVNGGEFLMLALATCYCNDLYREAARHGITLDAVEVEATAHFPGVGLAASDIRYRARVVSPAAPAAIAASVASRRTRTKWPKRSSPSARPSKLERFQIFDQILALRVGQLGAVLVTGVRVGEMRGLEEEALLYGFTLFKTHLLHVEFAGADAELLRPVRGWQEQIV